MTRRPGAWLLLPLWLAGCAGRLPSRPGLYDVSHELVELPKTTLDITYVKPASPRSPLLVAFATGDAGWFGLSRAIFEHLAARGYYVAGFDSRKALGRHRETGERISVDDTADGFEVAYDHAKRALGLPASTPLIVTGLSRGADMAIFSAAHEDLSEGVAGAVAIALTLESDYIRAPDPAHRHPALRVDVKDRILFYPILPRLAPMPVAVIQSTADRYCPAATSRRLMGPDTKTLRLYEVKAMNHGFDGGRRQLFAAIDEALDWIEASRAKS